MRILLYFMEDSYSGTPEEIVVRMFHQDHGRLPHADNWINRVSVSLKLEISGETFQDRCFSFVSQLIDRGWAEYR